MRTGLRTPIIAALAMVLLTGAASVPNAPLVPPVLEADLARAAQLSDDGKPDAALAILDARLAAAELPADRAKIETVRAFALAKLDRTADARKAAEVALAGSEAPFPGLLRLAFLLRLEAGDVAAATDLLITIADSQPALLKDFPAQAIGQTRFQIRDDEQRSFELSFALAQAKWRYDATVGSGDDLLLTVIRGLAARNRIEEARPLVAQLVEPDALTSLVVDRRYTALWKDLEARLGPRGDTAGRAWLAAAKAAYEKNPKSLVLRTDYATALAADFQRPAADTLLDIAKTPAELAALDNDEVWLVNRHARILASMGRIDAAQARLDALIATGVEKHPAVISMMINQALFLVQVGRPQAALAAADIADRNGAFANDYGKLYVAQARTCAQAELGRPADAAKAAAPILAAPKANDEATLAALVCLGRMDDAAALVTGWFSDDARRLPAIAALEKTSLVVPKSGRNARFIKAMATLRARPPVNAAFLKAARDLPPEFIDPRSFDN